LTKQDLEAPAEQDSCTVLHWLARIDLGQLAIKFNTLLAGSALPGFGNAAAAGSTAKKQQQAKSSKLNTPTKKNTTPPPAALAADAGARDILRNSAAAAATAAAANVAVDPYDFPADDCDEQQAGAATHMPANQQPQQPRPAAGSKFKTGSRLGALLGYGMRGGINNSSASRQLFSGVSGGAHAPFAGNSSAAAAGFASANTVVGTCMAGGQGRVKKQVRTLLQLSQSREMPTMLCRHRHSSMFLQQCIVSKADSVVTAAAAPSMT
jgi:hypothetical protein